MDGDGGESTEKRPCNRYKKRSEIKCFIGPTSQLAVHQRLQLKQLINVISTRTSYSDFSEKCKCCVQRFSTNGNILASQLFLAYIRITNRFENVTFHNAL